MNLHDHKEKLKVVVSELDQYCMSFTLDLKEIFRFPGQVL